MNEILSCLSKKPNKPPKRLRILSYSEAPQSIGLEASDSRSQDLPPKNPSPPTHELPTMVQGFGV